jgi:hypothetical protein
MQAITVAMGNSVLTPFILSQTTETLQKPYYGKHTKAFHWSPKWVK